MNEKKQKPAEPSIMAFNVVETHRRNGVKTGCRRLVNDIRI
ncbi:MAG: hypothetical protein PHC49_02075 [Desulfuromonadaceae bacterium]|nr:hypothetical protein [Desulfuromonadaceae bacterium]